MMVYPLNRVAVVTGGAHGLGAVVCHRLAADGHHTIVCDGAADAAEDLAAQLRDKGLSVSAVPADVARAHQVAALFGEVRARYGRVDVVVHAAGTAQQRPIADLAAKAYEEGFGDNVLGALNVLREAARHVAEWGRIVTISSTLVQSPEPGWAAYAASKAALELLGKVAAKELGPRSITVNAVRVEPTDPGSAASPLHRVGQPEDVADVIAFLAGDGGRWITGQVLTVDGGATT